MEIFDLNLNTISELTDENVQQTANKISKMFNQDLKNKELSLKDFNGKGLTRIAFKKFHDAYFTLKNPAKRKVYVENLQSLRKYKPKSK